MEITNKDWENENENEKDVISEVQKLLNRWRHECDLRIVVTHIIPGEQGLSDRVVVVLWRKRK